MFKKINIKAVSAAVIVMVLPITALASTGSTLDNYYGTTHIGFGGLSYSGGTIPQITISQNSKFFGNFYLGSSVNLAFGSIQGAKADRDSFDLRPGWIFHIGKSLDIIPYARAGIILQDVYSGSVSKPTEASLNMGYVLGGGIGVNWSPIHRLVISPLADISYYRQRYGSFTDGSGDKTDGYLSTTEYRERIDVNYYLTNWLSLGVYAGADQLGASDSSLVSYGGMLGVNF